MSDPYDHNLTHAWREFDSKLDNWDEYFRNFRCDCGAESDDGLNALPERPLVPIDTTPNVLDLNKVIDKVSAAIGALAETAEAAGVDLSDDMPHLERALDQFFNDRDTRAESSAAIRASEAGW